MMQIRLTTPEDYIELKEWWMWHRFPPPPIELLDNLRFGIMVHNDTENICSGFIFFTNAKQYGLMEYIVSTYKVRDKQLREQALILLIDSLIQIAKSKGVKVLFSSLKNQNLKKHYLKSGFIEGSTNTTEMICKL